MTKRFGILLVAACAAWGSVACHADPDDAAGQAGELADPVRREYALGNITRLYGNVLTANASDRNAAPVKEMVDATHQQLVQVYLDHPEDTQNGSKIMQLFYEMRDVRTMPALLKALEWRTEVNEDHAISSARTLRVLEIDNKGEVAKKLAASLERVTGKRPVDNRMRIEFLRTLGAIGDKAATPVLEKVALRQSEEQNFLINNLAVEQLGLVADPASVKTLVNALFMFDANDPRQRLNRQAPNALVRLGRAPLQPLLDTLALKNPEALKLSNAWIAAVKERAPQMAAQFNAESEVLKETAHALGVLGFREAIDPLIEVSKNEDPGVQLAAAVALASINRSAGDTKKVRDAMLAVYEAQPKIQKMQVLRAMQHMYDEGTLPFLLKVAKTPEQELPDIPIIAMNAYALLADKPEASRAQAAIEADKGPFKPTFKKQNDSLLTVAQACDKDLNCWKGKLDDGDEGVARKAAYMLGRLGRGQDQAITALVNKLDHPKEMVRGDVLSALDYAAVKGSPDAVAKIDAIREQEEGRAIWNHVKDRALQTQAKLAARGK